jgi:predicted dehydrogenase
LWTGRDRLPSAAAVDFPATPRTIGRMNTTSRHTLRAGMIGIGMIFDETYCPFFERAHAEGLYDRAFGDVDVPLSAVASRTGSRAAAYQREARGRIAEFRNFAGPDSVERLLEAGVDFACVATPDDRHFEACKKVLSAGVHLLVEKPSVLSLSQLDELVQLAEQNGVLAKVVYHKLLDPDHKKLRTLVADGLLQHVNNGYCSLLEPKQISGAQFSEWIRGRNPGTYVAVHYIKLIDFTFGGRLKTITATGQRGLVGPKDGPTWDSVQMRMVYEYTDGREAAFDIHTSWVTPDNFPGYVEQEVQFRFDNGVWNGHSRKRGVECTIEGQTPFTIKTTMNNHYNGSFLEPWGVRSQRGYGVEVIERFVRELAHVEFGGPPEERAARLSAARSLAYNDLSADRQVVAAVQALEAILARAARDEPDCVVRVNDPAGGLVLYRPADAAPEVLCAERV